MPKNKAQGVIFGILMSITMAYGMEVYNVAWKMGVPTMPGGFSNMTNDVFPSALVEASYMWLFVFLFSNLWGTRGGTPHRPQARQCFYPGHRSLVLHRPHHVPHDEPGCKHPLQRDSCGHARGAAPRHLGGDAHQELPDGAPVEPLCGWPHLAPGVCQVLLARG